MREPDDQDVFQELERDLSDLYRPFPLDPGFVEGVEAKISARAARLSSQVKTKGPSPQKGWMAGVFSTGRALAWGFLAVLFVAGLGWSIRHFLPNPMPAGGPGGEDIPKPASALIERFIWQSDGRFGYRMLRPVNWAPVDLGFGRGYTHTDPLELSALNYQVLQETQGSAEGAIAQWLIFQQNPTLEDWTTGNEKMWQQNGVEFSLEETLPRAKVYWIQVPGWDKIQLSALVVDQDQPMAIDLTAGGVYADADRLRNESILDDFITMVESLSAIPYSPEAVDPPLNEANSIPPTSTPVDHPSTPPVSTEIPGNLNLSSPHAEIRQRVLNPTWQTLWIQGQAKLISPTGVQVNFYVQAWLDQEGAGRVLSTDQIAGSLNFNLDMDPRWIWISEGKNLSLFDVQTGQFDPSTAKQQWFVHPLESAGQAMGMLFPSYLGVRSEDLQVVELSEQAGRPALVVDWAYFRLWVDAKTGALLRQQTRGEDGQVSQDIFLSAIAYNLPLPEGVLDTNGLEGVRFETAPVEAAAPESATPELAPPTAAPGSGWIVFDVTVQGSSELFMMDEGGLAPIQLTQDGDINFDPACSPDGRWIAFTGTRDGQRDIYLIRPDGSEETRLTSSSWQEMYPAFSPDGQKIAYTALQEDGNADIYVMDLDGSHSIRLTDHPAFDSAPAWSPDGTQIAFESERDGHWQIYVMNADGSGQRNLSNNPFMEHEPAWSPDGQRIAFHSDNRVSGGNEVIYMMSPDGSNVADLTSERAETSQRDMGPAWSPDGNWIFFSSYRDGYSSGVFKTPADGSGQIGLQIALTPTTLEAANPCWLPARFETLPGVSEPANATIRPDPADPNGQVNLRSGPGTEFPVAGALPGGTQLVALGRTEAGDWIQVEYPHGSGRAAWVFYALVELSGGELPVVEPPPTPIPDEGATGLGAATVTGDPFG